MLVYVFSRARLKPKWETGGELEDGLYSGGPEDCSPPRRQVGNLFVPARVQPLSR